MNLKTSWIMITKDVKTLEDHVTCPVTILPSSEHSWPQESGKSGNLAMKS